MNDPFEKAENENDPLSPEPDPETGFESDEEAAAHAQAQRDFETDEAHHDDDAHSDTDEADILRAELEKMKDQALRAMAEAENTRRRLLREREDVRKYAIADFAKDLLDFSDNFSRALGAIPAEAKNEDLFRNVIEGIESMSKDLVRTMEKHGITKIEPMNEPFNPNFHEALFEAPGTGKPAGMVVEVIEPGYVIQERLLRPARVGIAKDEGQGSAIGGIDTQA